MSHPPTPTPAHAAHAFRHFFEELREVYLERETLFTQIELALLSREHVLVVGPPGTAKSAIAALVLGRITDERTGQPSLFAKQLAESTVQTDLIGPVDFKVLTETGRTEYLTDDGMLGAAHAFLDEVFDGRDMLLRSILNVLHERELKHGRRITNGRIECAIMTSNRYLSEVVARSPELLQAFADRLSFISFVPKSFARRASRAAMLQRFSSGVRPDLRAQLTLQQLALLQGAVDKVQVPSQVLEGVELLADELERLLAAQVSRLPDYVPTKYFSQRTAVKALWALKAAVVRDQLYRHPERPLEASTEDLESLRWFFLLGGPPAEEVEALLKVAVDGRERSQLEIVRIEQKAFDAALEKVRRDLAGGPQREASVLGTDEDGKAVEALTRTFQPNLASSTAQRLRVKLVPGPRHPENRTPLVNTARALQGLAEQRMMRGPSEGSQGRAGRPLLAALAEVLELSRAVPELRARLGPLCTTAARFASHSLELVALDAESLSFEDPPSLEELLERTREWNEELSQAAQLARLATEGQAATQEEMKAAELAARRRVATTVRSRAHDSFARTRRAGTDSLSTDSQRLGQLDKALAVLDASQANLRQELLMPLGVAHAQKSLSGASFERLEQLARAVQSVAENLQAEGLAPEAVLFECRALVEARIVEHVRALTAQLEETEPANATQALNGAAYTYYRSRLSRLVPEGELAALAGLEEQLAGARSAPPSPFLSEAVHEAVAQLELLFARQRVRYLRLWLNQVLAALPSPEKSRQEADKAFEKLVNSRFPLLVLKEGELVRLRGVLALLAQRQGAHADTARKLEAVLKGMDEEFTRFSRRVLELRTTA